MLNRNSKKLIYLAIGLLILSIAGVSIVVFLFTRSPNYSYSCKINEVDGNQLNLDCEDDRKTFSKQVKICGVNIPESSKLEAEKLITSLTNNQRVAVNFVGLLGNPAEIFVSDGKDKPEKAIAEELLLNGLAEFVESDSCPNSVSMKSALEIAKQNRVGIWK
ncbi:MAG TPA: hypothetical protein VK203_27805 [Nostocaceae cyanobacterium]|nr:hypothetical protein [Nostocaceae cyanobacterium]